MSSGEFKHLLLDFINVDFQFCQIQKYIHKLNELKQAEPIPQDFIKKRIFKIRYMLNHQNTAADW